MRDNLSILFFDLIASSSRVFNSSSNLSVQVLLLIMSYGGSCDLKTLNRIKATPVAIRKHVSFLEHREIITISVNNDSRREKRIFMTQKGLSIVNDYLALLQKICASHSIILLDTLDHENSKK